MLDGATAWKLVGIMSLQQYGNGLGTVWGLVAMVGVMNFQKYGTWWVGGLETIWGL